MSFKRVRNALLIAFVAASLPACDGVQDLLDQLAGKPAANDTNEPVPQPSISVPAGPQLFCISNIGHTLVVFDLTTQQVLPQTRRYLDLDPAGPGLHGAYGYYLSQVASSGAGTNRLVEFLPKTALERRGLTFGVGNTNPTDLLVLPTQPDVGWVTLKGSTFDNFATRHIVVVRNLTGPGPLTKQLVSLEAITGDAGLTSPTAMYWDPGCPSNGGSPCVYLVVNNFSTGGIDQGVLLVLAPDGAGVPQLVTSVPLGLNTQGDVLLDTAAGELWVVNNGGYPPNHDPGDIQVLETTGWTTLDTIPDGTAPDADVVLSGIHGFSATQAWVTTYPADAIYTVARSGGPPFTINTAPGAPSLTGPLITTMLPTPALYAGKGGFGHARLVELNPSSGAQVANHDLQSGNGAITCAEYDVP